MAESPITYRKLENGEVGALAGLRQVYIDVFEEAGKGQADMEYLESLLRKDNVVFCAAIRAGVVIGGLTAYVLPSVYGRYSELYIYDMAVRTEYQRQGIGSKLLDYLKEYCKTTGVRDIFVQADAPDTEARNFYKKNGGTELDVRHYDFTVPS